MLNLTHKKEVCVNLFLWYHLTRCMLPIQCENSHQSIQEQKRNLFVSAILKLTHKKEVCGNLFLWYHLTRAAVYCQLKAKTLTQVIKNKKGIYLLVQCWNLHTKKKFVETSFSDIISQDVYCQLKVKTLIQVIKNKKKEFIC